MRYILAEQPACLRPVGRQETAANITLFISEKHYPRHCLAYPLYIAIGASLWLEILPIDEEVHFAENHVTGYAGHRCKCRIFAAHPIYRKRRKVQEGSSPPYGCGTAEGIQLYSGREYHKEAAGKGAGFCG